MEAVREIDAIHFLALIPLAWILISFLLSLLSGWCRLAKHYRASASESSQGNERNPSDEAEFAYLRTGRFSAVTYHSCLNFRVTQRGVRIAVAFPLRLGHPPLFIPWEEFHHVRPDDVRYSHMVKVSIGRPTLVKATLPSWVRYRMPLEIRPRATVTDREL
jgi:hypothetical protein